MSLEILLIPAAMAAYAGWQARADSQPHQCTVETRWRHAGLLVQSLHDLGATDVVANDEGTSATVDGVAVTFTRAADGIVTAHFPRATEVARAVAVVDAIDASYTRRVQDAVYRRVRERVAELGYEIESESVDAEETITLVVNVA